MHKHSRWLLAVFALLAVCNFAGGAQGAQRYTKENTAAVMQRIQAETSTPEFKHALMIYLSGAFGEAQKLFIPLADSGNSMAAFYVWKCNVYGRESDTLRSTDVMERFASWPVKDESGKEILSFDPLPYLIRAAERDNPHAMFLLGTKFVSSANPERMELWKSKAVAFWSVRAREANDGDGWYYLGRYVSRLPQAEKPYENDLENRIEYFFRGVQAGSELALDGFASIREEDFPERFKSQHPEWKRVYLDSLKKAADSGSVLMPYRYWLETGDEAYLKKSIDNNYIKAWHAFATGLDPLKHKDMVEEKAFWTEDKFFMLSVFSLYKRGTTLEYENMLYQMREAVSEKEYAAIVDKAKAWLKDNRLYAYWHSLPIIFSSSSEAFGGGSRNND